MQMEGAELAAIVAGRDSQHARTTGRLHANPCRLLDGPQIDAVRKVPGVIAPFPGGVVRSGSKVGSRYKKLKASTNDAYCPTLRGVTKTALPEGANAVYEIVLDGVDLPSVEEATRVGVRAACVDGVLGITAGNYGGKLGPFHLHLHKLLAAQS